MENIKLTMKQEKKKTIFVTPQKKLGRKSWQTLTGKSTESLLDRHKQIKKDVLGRIFG